MKTTYPYTGEAPRFKACFHALLDIGARLNRDDAGELVITSRDPIPPRLMREVEYFKSFLLWIIGEEKDCPSLSVASSLQAREVPRIAD